MCFLIIWAYFVEVFYYISNCDSDTEDPTFKRRNGVFLMDYLNNILPPSIKEIHFFQMRVVDKEKVSSTINSESGIYTKTPILIINQRITQIHTAGYSFL